MSQETVRASEIQAALAFAERWAEFTKAYAIYPSANVRVRATLETMLATLPDAIASSPDASQGGLEICFYRDALHLDGEVLEVAEGTGLHWLHQRIHRALLAGVTFEAEATEQAILAFTDRLLELYTRTDETGSFEELWSESYEGLRLIDRRFEGSFGDEAADDGGPLRSWGSGGAAEIDTSLDSDIVDRISQRPEIRDALEALHHRLAEHTADGDATTEIDILSRIVRQMPGDVMEDEDRLVGIAEAAMRRLGEKLDEAPGSALADLTSDGDVLQLMFEASHGLLGRVDDGEQLVPEIEHLLQPGKSKAPGPRGGGYKRRDDEISDDEAAFHAELESLPPPYTKPLTDDSVGDTSEQVGVFLHFLRDGSSQEIHPFAERGLVKLLREAGPADAAILRQYLAPASGPAEEAQLRRLIELLRRNRIATVLRDHGLLSPDSMLKTFPNEFGLYLDSLDLTQVADREELSDLVAKLRPERIHEFRDALIETERILETGRVEHLLSAPSRSLLPFLRIVLEQGSPNLRPQAIGALRRIYAKNELACLLFVFDPGEQMPVWYLRALTDPEIFLSADRELRTRISKALLEFLRGTVDPQRRAYAIQKLVRFMTPEAALYLEGLLRNKTFWLIPKEPRLVRTAARQALKATRM